MKLSSKEEIYRAAQLPHFVAIAALSLNIDPDDTEALKANSNEIYGRAAAMIAGMNAYLASIQKQQRTEVNG
jgi:hypothetical protein